MADKRRAHGPARRQRGAVALMFAMMLVTLLGLLGIVLDLGRVYNRKAELQSVVDTAALAAARQLSGTRAGIDQAVQAAQAAAAKLRYQYNQSAVAMPASWVTFNSRPEVKDTAWVGQSEAGNGAGLFYVKVETDPELDTVPTPFIRILSASLGTVAARARAVASRPSIKLMPLAICALDSDHPTGVRHNPDPADPANSAYDELLEFGFRRGITYSLRPETSFLVNPMPVGQLDAAAAIAASDAAPFVCSGSMLRTHVVDAVESTVWVQSQFPFASLFNYFNARFDKFTATSATGCSTNMASIAPPDLNIKEYLSNGTSTTVNWMRSPGWPAVSVFPKANAALLDNSNDTSRLTTKADQPAGTPVNADQYGPLWAYSRPLKFAATPPYVPFEAAAWSRLYPDSAGAAPAAGPQPYNYVFAPYRQSTFGNLVSPSRPGLPERRVLNLPLLACPVAGSAVTVVGRAAKVVGIGQFFMMAQANPNGINAEFAGALGESDVGGPAELYR